MTVVLEGRTVINHAWKTSSEDPQNFKVRSEDSDLSYVLPISVEMRHLIKSKTERPDELYRVPIALLNEYRETDRTKFLARIAVRLGDKFVPVHLHEVFWIQSKGNLLCIHLQDVDYDCRITMKGLSLKLDPTRSLRVHRNAIVNLDYVVEFDLPRYGNAFVLLRNGKALPISRTGRMALRRSLLPRSYAGVGDGQ